MKNLVRFVRRRYRELGDPARAAQMAAYMKTDMPFYGVQKPQRVVVCRELDKRFPITSRREYEAAITALWSGPHREEKYTAIHVARRYPAYVTLSCVPLYRRLIREGAWWDLVDEVSVQLVGRVLLNQRPAMKLKIEWWIDDRDLWIRRSALLSQIGHKTQTDETQLFDHCLRRADEQDFFIRKAVGWALRDYAWTAPDAVRRFLRAHRDRLSALSFREAARNLGMS